MASLKEASKRNRMHFRNLTDRTPFRNRSRAPMFKTGVSPTALHCQWGGGTDNTASTWSPRMIVGAPCCKRTRGHNTSMRRAVPTEASVQRSHLHGRWSALPANSGDITARRPHGRAPNPGLCCESVHRLSNNACESDSFLVALGPEQCEEFVPEDDSIVRIPLKERVPQSGPRVSFVWMFAWKPWGLQGP